MYARAPTWSPDGTQLAFQALKLNTGTNTEDIWIASVAGGTERRLTSSSSSEYYPAWSPDGLRIAFVSRRHDTTGVCIMPVQGGAVRKLIDFADAPSWSPNGSKLAVRMSSGVGIYSFVDETLTRLSTPSIYYPLWLDEKSIVLMESFNFSQLAVAELQNAQLKFPIAELGFHDESEPAWFPDNNTIAFTKAEPSKQEIWTVSLATGESRLLLANIPGENFFRYLQNPAISPNGMILACDNGRDVFIISQSGGGLRKLAADLNEPLTQPAWSPDSKQLACRTPYGLRVFSIQENRIQPHAYFSGAFLNPSWSAVHPIFGSHISFERDGSIYIFSLTNPKPEWVIPGGRYPSWSPDGTKIAYVFGNDIYVSTVLVPFVD